MPKDSSHRHKTLRSEVLCDWTSFDLSRASRALFSGDLELRRRPSTPECKARSSYGDQPGAIHCQWHFQQAAIAGNAYQQRRDVVCGRVDECAQCDANRLCRQRRAFCHRRPKRHGAVQRHNAWIRVHLGRGLSDDFHESRRGISIQGIRIRHADLPLSAAKLCDSSPDLCHNRRKKRLLPRDSA
jgi:hypothetical protein